MYPSLYQLMVKNVYPGEKLRHFMSETERLQWYTGPQLEAIQLKKIKRLLRYAYENVPFYRKHYQLQDTSLSYRLRPPTRSSPC